MSTIKISKRLYFNIVANFLGRGWSIISNIIFVPIYIKYIGEEAYGLITFFTTLQTIMNIFGLGLSKTIRKEFATDNSLVENRIKKYKLIRSVEFIYLLISALIIIICFFIAPLIATKWLDIENLDSGVVISVLRLMGISIALQIISNMYIGCLYGMEYQVKANLFQAVWALIKYLGSSIILIMITKNLIVFYLWYNIVDLIYVLVLRVSIISDINLSHKRWNVKDLKYLYFIRKFSLGIFFISIGYTINTQIDKFIISTMFPISAVGAYNTAFNLSYAMTIISSSIGNASFSRFSNLYSNREYEEHNNLFIKISNASSLIIIAIGSYVAVFSNELILIWTKSVELSNIVKDVTPFIIIGSTFSALQEVAYEYLLSCGIVIYNNIMTYISILYNIIITPFFIRLYGINGAGYSWLILMSISSIIYLSIVYKKANKDNWFKLLLSNIIFPFVLSLSLAIINYRILSLLNISNIMFVALAILFGSCTLVILFYIFNNSYIKSIYMYISNRTRCL